MSGREEFRLARVPTGIAGLDTILGGGFFQGGLYIIQGPPGSGKTTLANQMCFNHLAAGGRAIYVTLLAEYHARMLQHLSSMTFFDPAKIPDQISYISGFGALRQDGPQGLLNLLRREIADRSCTMLIVDGFAAARHASGERRNLNEFVHELQGIAIATDCTMFLLTGGEGTRDAPEYTIVDGSVELNDQLFGWSAESALQIIKLRGSGYLRGRHAFQITDDGITVYPRIEALLAQPTRPDAGGTEKRSSGTERLDAMLGGGLPVASTTMIIGPTGVGKTTLGLQFLSQSSDAEPGLLFGFYETPARLRVKAGDVCPPLRGLIEDGTVEVLWQPPSDGLLDAYGERLLEAVQRRNVRRLFIDGLGALRNAARPPARMGHFLNALTNELRVRGVTTVYTLEVPDIIGAMIRAPISDLSSLAENLILLRFIELRAQLHRLISILKVRDSDFDPSLYRYSITEHGLVLDETYHTAESIMADFARVGPLNPHGAAQPESSD